MGAAHAQTLVNFDESGILALTDVTTQYVSDGVTFYGMTDEGDVVNIEAANNTLFDDVNAFSPPNALSNFYEDDDENRAHIMVIDFTSAASGITLEYNPAGPLGPGTVFNIYNTSGALVDSFSDPNATEDGEWYLETIPDTDVGQIQIVNPQSGWGHYIDNLQYSRDAFQVAPSILTFSFTYGSPIPSTNLSLTLIDAGTNALNWTLTYSSSLLNVAATTGALAPGASAPLALNFTPAIASLTPGFYPIALNFTNLSDGFGETVQVNIQVLLATLASFAAGDGENPHSPLLQAGDGNLYGTTVNGGGYGEGTVFRISTNGLIATLYSFTGGNDGGNSSSGVIETNPAAGLIQASDGQLYGTTEFGGTYGFGTVFQITTNGSLTTLYSFTGGMDGGNSTASLMQASDGNLYGTASGGNLFGALFRITTNGAFTALYSFSGANDGAYPEAPLIQARDGNLYGTASAGGINGLGTVFRVSLSGDFDSFFSFNDTDGATPAGGLVQGVDGYLYGTTASGTDRTVGGTVFRISTNGTFNSLYLFPVVPELEYGYYYEYYIDYFPDGSSPSASLFQASDGSLYGTTDGETNGEGTIFRISTNGEFTLLYSFSGGSDGGNSFASLIQAGDGSLYGTASSGGAIGYGTVFQITTNGTFSLLHAFLGSTHDSPLGALQISGGNFYGITQYGGTNGAGSIFEAGTNGAITTLYSFSASTGDNPESGLIQASDGLFYGTTEQGGADGYGTIFQVSTNGTFTVLYDISNYAYGAYPAAALVQASDGYLYGTTSQGGTDGDGTFFQTSTNGGFKLLHSFNGTSGAYPAAALIQASDGLLYGTTESGGNDGDGTIFKVTTNGAFTRLYTFSGDDGASPEAALVQASNGYLYGTTEGGGANGDGTIFQISTNGGLTTLYSFSGVYDGSYPTGSLIQAGNGDLYGTTPSGGLDGFGTVFQITPKGGFTVLYSFSGGADGGDPAGGLVLFDGFLYGTTAVGGANGNGGVFQILIPAAVVPPVSIGPPLLSGGSLILSFPTTIGQSYTIQENTNVATANWFLYTNFSGDGQPLQLAIPATNVSGGFFRVIEP